MHVISRRKTLAAFSSAAIVGAIGKATAALPKQLKVGYQKGEPVLVAAKQNRSFETALEPLGVSVSWLEFPYGPPLLEAMRVGGVDIGGVGDTPPVFAQAAHADLVYIAARPDSGNGSAVLLPAGSTLRTLADLKGKRVAFARGSSAHNLTIAALEKGGLTYADIQPIYLAPADAAAAFEHGDVDAWTIWDPYYSIAESRPGVRVLASTKDITPQNSFYLARRDYSVAGNDIIAKVVASLGNVGDWCDAHHPEVAAMIVEATGVPLTPTRRAVDRASFRSLPMSADLLTQQQQVADRFFHLGLIPAALDVRGYAWRASS